MSDMLEFYYQMLCVSCLSASASRHFVSEKRPLVHSLKQLCMLMYSLCLDKHYLGMTNPGLYLLSSMKLILALSTYLVYFLPSSLQSILPVVS